ncbi:MAG: hypothetical protein ACREEY_04235 [Brevundimonas sp.]
MVAFKTVHRLAAIGAGAFFVVFLGFIASFSDHPPLLATAWKMSIATDDGFHVFRLILIVTSVLAFILRGRGAAVFYAFVAILVVAPVCWLVLELLHRFGGGQDGEYWAYFAQPSMYPWLLAPWLADYALTLSIACLGLWMATLPRSAKQALVQHESGI